MAETRGQSSPSLPPGQWFQGRSRFPNPLTPLCADYRMLDILVQGLRRAFDSASLPVPVPMNVVIDGYWYGGPNGPADTSAERIAAFEAYVAEAREERLVAAWEVIRPASLRHLRELQQVSLGELDHAGLRNHIERVLHASRETMARHHINGVGYAVQVGRLGLFSTQNLGLTEAQIVALLGGASPASREPVRVLSEIARRIGGDVNLRRALDHSTESFDPQLVPLVQPWLDEYGYRNPAFEYDQPLIAEQPQLLVKLLRDLLAGSPPSEGEVDVSRVVETVAPGYRVEFERLLAGARQAYAVRDDDVSHLQWSQGLLRMAFLEVGRRLAGTGTINTPEDVWYLTRVDMEEYLAAGQIRPLLETVAKRRQLRDEQAKHRPPVALGEPLTFRPPALSAEAQQWLRARAWATAGMDAGPGRDADRAADIRGIGASSGRYTGPACVVLDESEFDKLEPGDVLVCQMTTPSWNVVFATVGALVADFGGQLSHPAIIAREFGIPAVVGAIDATLRIKDGATVTVDGATGVVTWY